MRLLYQSMTPVEHLTHYSDALKKHAKKSCLPDTQVDFKGVQEGFFEGSSPTEIYRYPYLKHRILSTIIENGRQAQADGYDAFILGSFSEPYLAELRSLLSIPVVSMVESCCMTASSLGDMFAFVCLSKVNTRRVKAIVTKHGMLSRVSGWYALPVPFEENQLNASFANPDALIAAFTQAATQAAEDGADVVIPSEGVMTEVLHFSGVKTIAGATVMDSVGATMTYAEMLVHLMKRSGLTMGRKWSYQQPSPEMLALLDNNLNNHRKG